jgi:hypothetical protein
MVNDNTIPSTVERACEHLSFAVNLLKHVQYPAGQELENLSAPILQTDSSDRFVTGSQVVLLLMTASIKLLSRRSDRDRTLKDVFPECAQKKAGVADIASTTQTVRTYAGQTLFKEMDQLTEALIAQKKAENGHASAYSYLGRPQR